MDKSPEAFRTISEVADFLDTPAHVLRFWESRFPQIRPVKRAGGRRYYRPGDVALLAGIKKLLHDEGMTIRGVQKILREHGIRHVSGLGSGEAGSILDDINIEAVLTAEYGPRDRLDATGAASPEAMQSAQIISLETALNRQEAARDGVPEQPELWPQATPDSPAEHINDWSAAPADAGSDENDASQAAQFISDHAARDVDNVDSEREVTTNESSPAPDLNNIDLSGPDLLSGNDATPPEGVPGTGPGAVGDSPLSAGRDEQVSTDADEATPVATLLRRHSARDVATVKPQLIHLRDRLIDLRGRVAEAARRKAK